MAKQKGLVKLTGSIDDISFYYSKRGGYLMRQKGGPSKQKIKKGRSFTRTRENISEFSAASSAGKWLRSPVNGLLTDVSDGMLVPRMQALLVAIKNYDTTNLRGERRVGPALAHPEAQQLLQEFAFNERAPLDEVLSVTVITDTLTGTVSASGIVPRETLSRPAAATHVRFQAARVRVNLGTGGSKATFSTPAVSALNGDSIDFALTLAEPAALPAKEGQHQRELYFLQVVFLQEVNGEVYGLKGGNSLGVVAIG